ncbi:MAG: hypothetical protein LBM21_00040, partial [Coriobacteriales bacterium]|nr:hypothetical protein [Coriobacteriales bacterium]
MPSIFKAALDHGADAGGVPIAQSVACSSHENDGYATRHPVRTALPFLLFPLGCLWMGLALSEVAIWQEVGIPGAVVLLSLSGSVALAFVAALFVRARALRIAFVCAIAFIVGINAGCAYWNGVQADANAMQESSLAEARLLVLDDPKSGTMFKTSTARVSLANGKQATVRIYWDKKIEPYPQGSRFTANLSFSALNEKGEWLFQRGICGAVRMTDVGAAAFRNDVFGAI